MFYHISVFANPPDIPTLFHNLNMSHEFIQSHSLPKTDQQ